jgi:hypothetical protein
MQEDPLVSDVTRQVGAPRRSRSPRDADTPQWRMKAMARGSWHRGDDERLPTVAPEAKEPAGLP